MRSEPTKLTWEDVAVPSFLVKSIKSSPTDNIDYLLHHLVFGHNQKVSYTYNCANCGEDYRPERSSEEVIACVSCGHWQITRNTTLYFGNIPNYLIDPIKIVYEMIDNYSEYFGTKPAKSCDVGWVRVKRHDNVYARFPQGEKVICNSPAVAIAKAAVLCPYLWKDKQLSPILNSLFTKKRRRLGFPDPYTGILAFANAED